VQLDIFYESMCPFCHKFFNETLKMVWKDSELKSRIDLHLFPAGNLQVVPAEMVSRGYFFWHEEKANDKYIFICQHGESECLGNLIHMCATKVLADPEVYMPLLFCMAAKPDSVPEKSSYACMQELSVAPEPIRECVQSSAANAEMYSVTQADAGLVPERKYVPWVVVNGRHLEIGNGKADLRSTLCQALGDDAPPTCAAARPRAAAALSSTSDEVVSLCYRNATRHEA